MRRIRLLLAASVVAATTLIAAPPAHACFNPDDPWCPTQVMFCNATEKVAKYRDKIVTCYP